ncbi:hypothetical protein D3C79_753520 [compost metagenome]
MLHRAGRPNRPSGDYRASVCAGPASTAGRCADGPGIAGAAPRGPASPGLASRTVPGSQPGPDPPGPAHRAGPGLRSGAGRCVPGFAPLAASAARAPGKPGDAGSCGRTACRGWTGLRSRSGAVPGRSTAARCAKRPATAAPTCPALAAAARASRSGHAARHRATGETAGFQPGLRGAGRSGGFRRDTRQC